MIIRKAKDLENYWVCMFCGHLVEHEKVLESFEELEQMLNCLDKELEEVEDINNNDPGLECTQKNVNLMEEALYKMSLIAHHKNYWIIQVMMKQFRKYHLHSLYRSNKLL